MTFAARDSSAEESLDVTAPPPHRRPPGGLDASRPEEFNDVVLRNAPRGVRGPSDDQVSVRHHRPTTVTYARGQQIFGPDGGSGYVYIVRSGYVRLFKVLPDNRSVNLGLLGPNTVFVQEDSYDGLASGASSEALVETTLSIVELDNLARLIAESPDLASAIVAGMTRRLTELQTLVEHLLVRDASIRLVTTLLALAKGFGRPTADGMVAIALPLTHQGLAGMIGSNRVTVTRRLLDLQEAGIVRSLGRNALAVDPERLRAYAQASRSAK
jgi:CRP/FNR family transcriptional regulator